MPSDHATDATLCPESVEELSETLRASDSPVLVYGGGFRLTFANDAPAPATQMSLSALNSVLLYEPADLTIAVEAGATISAVNAVLAEHNQMLPLDSPSPETETFGGMFASGMAGPRRLKYGSLRDWVLGLEVAGPDGLVTRSGGMVVKNVTGYDVPRLHYGMHGTLGIVTRLNLKVLPRDEATRSIVMTFADVDDAFQAAFTVLGSQLEAASILISGDGQWTLSVTCGGPESSIDWQAGTIVEAAEAVSKPLEIAVTEAADAGLQPFLRLTDLRRTESLARLSVPASQQPAAITRLAGLIGSETCADPGSGLIYVYSAPSLEWRDALRTLHPDTVFLSVPENLKQGIDVFGPVDRHSLDVYRRLKNQHDPTDRLNPGRFIRYS